MLVKKKHINFHVKIIIVAFSRISQAILRHVFVCLLLLFHLFLLLYVGNTNHLGCCFIVNHLMLHNMLHSAKNIIGWEYACNGTKGLVVDDWAPGLPNDVEKPQCIDFHLTAGVSWSG
jgi:hypothetical protein